MECRPSKKKIIPDLSDSTSILYKMVPTKTKRNFKLRWTEEGRAAFYRVKDRLSKCIVLNHPIPGARLNLYSDASQHSMGAYLTQINDETKEETP